MKKRIKGLWKSLFNRPKYIVVNVDKTNHLHVIEIDTSDNMVAGLGMTNERANELTEICEKAFEGSINVCQVMEIVSKHCKHANELYVCSVIVTKTHERRMNPMSGIIEMIFEGRKGGPQRPDRP